MYIITPNYRLGEDLVSAHPNLLHMLAGEYTLGELNRE
jgi:hypothetical protein